MYGVLTLESFAGASESESGSNPRWPRMISPHSSMRRLCGGMGGRRSGSDDYSWICPTTATPQSPFLLTTYFIHEIVMSGMLTGTFL